MTREHPKRTEKHQHFTNIQHISLLMKITLLILLSISNSTFGFITNAPRKPRFLLAAVFDDFDAARKSTIIDAMHCSDSGMEAAAEEA